MAATSRGSAGTSDALLTNVATRPLTALSWLEVMIHAVRSTRPSTFCTDASLMRRSVHSAHLHADNSSSRVPLVRTGRRAGLREGSVGAVVEPRSPALAGHRAADLARRRSV